MRAVTAVEREGRSHGTKPMHPQLTHPFTHTTTHTAPRPPQALRRYARHRVPVTFPKMYFFTSSGTQGFPPPHPHPVIDQSVASSIHTLNHTLYVSFVSSCSSYPALLYRLPVLPPLPASLRRCPALPHRGLRAVHGGKPPPSPTPRSPIPIPLAASPFHRHPPHSCIHRKTSTRTRT